LAGTLALDQWDGDVAGGEVGVADIVDDFRVENETFGAVNRDDVGRLESLKKYLFLFDSI